MASSELDIDIGIMYDQVIKYIEDKLKYVEDPSLVSNEYNDFYADFDLTELITTMQIQVNRRPTIGEAALIKAYRDLRATQAEYAIRLTKRSDYYIDTANEEFNNKEKWEFNKKNINSIIIERGPI